MTTHTSIPLLLALALVTALADARPAVAQEPMRVTLEEALELFARNNLELRIARAEAAALIGETRDGAAYPNPALTGTHEPLSDGDETYSESYVNLSQRLVWPGTRSAVGAATRHTIEAVRRRFAADSARLTFEVKRAFTSAAEAEEVANVLGRVTDVFRTGDESARERYAEGDISLYHRRRIQVERARYETRLAEAELEAAAARDRLAILLTPDEEEAEIAPVGLPDGNPSDVASAGLVDTAFSRRLDLGAAESAARSAGAEASAVRRGRIPDLVATGGYKTQSDGFTGAFLGLTVELPVWNREGAAVDAAEAQESAALARLALMRRQVENDVENARRAYASAVERMDVFDPTPAEGADLLDIARLSYREGEMELIDLLDAAEAHLDAETARIRLRGYLWVRYYDLERAVGGFEDTTNDGGAE